MSDRLDPMVIPLGIAVLLAGTLAFVVALTLAARLVNRLIDVAMAARSGASADDARHPVVRRPAVRARRRFGAVPRAVLAAMIAGSLLFALAWSTFVLGRVRDLG